MDCRFEMERCVEKHQKRKTMVQHKKCVEEKHGLADRSVDCENDFGSAPRSRCGLIWFTNSKNLLENNKQKQNSDNGAYAYPMDG